MALPEIMLSRSCYCQKCERFIGTLGQLIEDRTALTHLCQKCIADRDEQNHMREAEIAADPPEGLSSPESFELRNIRNYGGNIDRIIAFRSDVRWYKKFGSNGDG